MSPARRHAEAAAVLLLAVTARILLAIVAAVLTVGLVLVTCVVGGWCWMFERNRR